MCCSRSFSLVNFLWHLLNGQGILPFPLHDLMIAELSFRLLSWDLSTPLTTTEDEVEVALREPEGLLSRFSLGSTFCFLRDLLTPRRRGNRSWITSAGTSSVRFGFGVSCVGVEIVGYWGHGGRGEAHVFICRFFLIHRARVDLIPPFPRSSWWW